MEMLGLREVVCSLVPMFFVYISFRSPADVISGLAVLLIQEWKLRVEKGMFAISYLRDKHIYHSD